MSVRIGGLSLAILIAAGCSSGDRTRGGDEDKDKPDAGTEPGDEMMGKPEGVLPAGPEGAIDPMCVDGLYSEVMPMPSADLSDLVESYDPENPEAALIAALERRYPIGAEILKGGLEQRQIGDGRGCVQQFLDPADTLEDLLLQASVFVHECGHFFDLGRGGFSESVYVVTPDVVFSCDEGDTTDRGGRTFARSLLNGDEFAQKRPACGSHDDGECDSYADVYLDGDPSDQEFQGGDQGFNSVLEETTQYVNSLATGYAFRDQLENGQYRSERDGILTFLWYIERYLRLARTEYPEAYELLVGDACWQGAILTVWGRAWLFLDATEGMSNLGISDQDIYDLVTDPELLAEIDMVRDRTCR